MFLSGALQAGCLNPIFFDKVEIDVNHAPVLTGMTPAPTFDRVNAQLGPDCAPLESFRAVRLDDADEDVLTVRWTLLLPRDGTLTGARVNLLEVDLEPLVPRVEGLEYDFQPFQLDRAKVLGALGPSELASQAQREEGQLLELRISDRGFKTGTFDAPDGADVVYMSWAVKVNDAPCGSP